jgi:hypothetical protein
LEQWSKRLKGLRVLSHRAFREELGGLGEKMKLQFMFLLMDILMFLACGYLWLKTTFAHVHIIAALYLFHIKKRDG